MRTDRLKARMLPVMLALCSTASAAVVDCTNLTITCTTFQKGSVKFKPVLSTGTFPSCAASVPANLEAISIKGTLADCTVTGANLKVVSGSAKGTLYTGDCTCQGLGQPSNPIVTPPPGKTSSVVVSWKFDSTSTDTCMSGQKSSTLVLVPGAAIATSPFSPGPPFPGSAFYGRFSLGGPGTGVSGIFQGGNLGATSVLVGLSTESVFFLANTCAGPKGLKGLAFGQAAAELK